MQIVNALRGDFEKVKLLMENWSTLEYTVQEGGTALMYAKENGHLDIVTILLHREVWVDLQTKHGVTTALMLSASHGHLEIAGVLMLIGADLDLKHKSASFWKIRYILATFEF
jgi:ankyrin repeat protein